jgi:putative ABC transport system permease protein
VLARRLLRATLPEEIREEVLGDLEEQWRQKPRGAAWYWRQALAYSMRFAVAACAELGHAILAACVQPDCTQDIRHAFRSLRRSWAFSISITAILGIGLGAATAIFSIYYGILLRPFPYASPDQLIRIDWLMTTGQSQGSSLTDFQLWRTASRSFSGLGIFSNSAALIRGRGAAEQVPLSYVSSGTLGALGVSPQIGRLFTPAEDVPNGDVHKAILSDSLWRRSFGSDAAILGQTVNLGGNPMEIIGVMPAGFAFPNRTEMWIPVESSWTGSNPVKRASVRAYSILGRLDPRVRLEAAREELRALSPSAQNNAADLVPRIRTLREAETIQLRPYLIALLGGVGCLVLICVANISSLQIARGAARQREFAVRAAIGASVARNLRAQFAESILLAIGGAIIGGLVAVGSVHVILARIPVELPAWMHLEVDLPAFAFCTVLAGVASIITGVLPAWRASRQDPNVLIRAGGRGRTERSGLRKGLVAAEIGLSTMLLVSALLMMQTLFELQKREPGFRADGLLTIRAARVQEGTPVDRSRVLAQLHERVLERLGTLPGVTSVGMSNRLPFTSTAESRMIADLKISGAPGNGAVKASFFGSADVTPEYFATMGIPLLRGRTFTRRDRAGSQPVLIVNQRAAKLLWPNQEPLGQQVTWGTPRADNPPATVVGIVGEVRNFASEADRGLEFYYPYAQFPADSVFYVIRTSVSPDSLTQTARRTIQETEPGIAVSSIKPMPQWVDESLWQTRLWSWLLGAFAGVALVLAALGLYGVVAYLAMQRSKEMVIRISLGATAGQIAKLMLGGMMQLVGFGVCAGVAGSLAASKLIGTLLFQVSPTDIRTYVTVSALVGSVALVACFPPILRASRVDPASILKEE